jgi:A/G-specific adenine glycosylase
MKRMLQAAPSSANPPDGESVSSAALLLAWYDRHGRDLPWRVKGGAPADPYRVWLSEIMLQQTTVEAVKPYFARFLALWPDVRALAAAETEALMQAWAGLGYYARARNLQACAKTVVARHDGAFPADAGALRALPGIGDYTSAAIAAIAFQQPALVIDGNVERVIARLFRIESPLPQAKPAIRAALATIAPAERPGDFAQAMMDLGATVCTPKRPNCLICPWSQQCAARASGDAARFPEKLAKKARPIRHGVAFVAVDPLRRVLIGTRPPRGLLGGMSEVPNSDWLPEGVPEAEPPLRATWQQLDAPVIHVFTHFELRLDVRVAKVKRQDAPAGLRWVPVQALAGEALPTLMRKVLEAALRPR